MKIFSYTMMYSIFQKEKSIIFLKKFAFDKICSYNKLSYLFKSISGIQS
jgi:hypothetical protein